MASMASAARDIPQGSSRDNLTAVAARSAPVTRSHPLPTPPNSISPALPPHGLKAQLQKAKLEPIESDLDLHDDNHPVGSPAYDSAGVPITTTLLARDYLPEILLSNGPLAIRYIMGHLTSALPGFATIPPAKARRLVVGALEGRGSGAEGGGGKDGDVVFEKVGWGRWDARRRGQPPRQTSPSGGNNPSCIPISANGWSSGRPRLTASSLGGESAAFSHDDRDLNMMDHEADKMSLDGTASVSPSCSENDDDINMDDPDEATDDEDWASVGAAALRAASYADSAKGGGLSPAPSLFSSRVYTSGPGGSRSFSENAATTRYAAAAATAHRPQRPSNLGTAAALGGVSDAQEREAVEALLRLGSV
ncbi:putative Sin3 binding protein-domain-containing protein [Zalerion maritima]|uniref:Sin3 binding protein-domain-containing protein n=1 Tax=Zalerion maritima TaxID=339359 RepID=A0AAD5WPQ0_9PEZI|nr:putative Sin3 binding protein-domain-containing protein [Zalerion maritima]